jgi:hypothetical protein
MTAEEANPDAQYRDAWRDLNRRYAVFWWTGALATIAWALELFGVKLTIEPWILCLPFFGAMIWLTAFNCPRCGKSFAGFDKYLSLPGGGAVGGRTQCAYCHLKRGT